MAATHPSVNVPSATHGVTPTIEAARLLATQGNLIPVFRDYLADMETPVSVYGKVARGAYSFLLESVEGGERLARYSFIGTEPRLVASLRDGNAIVRHASGAVEATTFSDPLAYVRNLLAPFRPVALPDMPRFVGGVVGYLAYECARYFERLPVPERDDLHLPDAVVMLADTLIVFDHVRHRMRVLAHADVLGHGGDVDAAWHDAVRRVNALAARLESPASPTPRRAPLAVAGGRGPAISAVPDGVTSTLTRDAYEGAVERAREYVSAGDLIQVVPSQRLSRPVNAPALTVYRALRAVNPSPYMYFLDLGDMQIAGASPEMLVQVDDGVVRTRPIAGTRPRGADQASDDAHAADLLADEKERAEHIMLVDLGRNDIGRISKVGTVRVTDLMVIERYSHVMHIVSQVEGHLRDDCDAYDALRACFPAGTVSGAPKIRAMEVIAELEPCRRGTYAGCVGYFSFDGNLDTAITIRTMVLKDGMAHVQSGGGIVYDSSPAAEYQETLNKAAALLRALDLADQLVDAPTEAAP
ncbi:MAG: anthranilate synthase component I [Chloroflexi bacterium]|jgi:anthranilate synthase component 1|nr:anthranilate synthase component I [Chloroflexota bacterium]